MFLCVRPGQDQPIHETDLTERNQTMRTTKLLRGTIFAIIGASIAATGAAAGPFPIGPIADTGIVSQLQPMQVQYRISLDPGDFKGFDSSGKRQRVRIRSAGNGYTLQTLTGKNSGQVFYVHQGGNDYKAADGTTLVVTSTRSFTWNGWLGTISMVD
jgi:hypothetical protein